MASKWITLPLYVQCNMHVSMYTVIWTRFSFVIKKCEQYAQIESPSFQMVPMFDCMTQI